MEILRSVFLNSKQTPLRAAIYLCTDASIFSGRSGRPSAGYFARFFQTRCARYRGKPFSIIKSNSTRILRFPTDATQSSTKHQRSRQNPNTKPTQPRSVTRSANDYSNCVFTRWKPPAGSAGGALIPSGRSIRITPVLLNILKEAAAGGEVKRAA